MPSFNFKGTVEKVSEKQTYGNVTVVSVTVKSDEDYPQMLALDFVNKMAPVGEGFKAGDVHTFSTNVNGRESKTGKLFVTLNCWKVDKQASEQPKQAQMESTVPF